MNDGFVTTEVFFAIALLYIFGPESLTKIAFVAKDERYPKHQEREFSLDIPSFDAAEYLAEYKAGTLAISDLKAFARIHNDVTRIFKDMGRNGDTEYYSPSWLAGRGR
jgi:hypothetical protein